MSDLFGNHIVGFPTRQLSFCYNMLLDATLITDHLRLFLLYVYPVYSHYNTDWTVNTKIGLNPNNSVIKRLWCTSTLYVILDFSALESILALTVMVLVANSGKQSHSEPPHRKTNYLHMRKQRRRSASQ